uniref:Glutaredoxin domain-containing protein n=1 Tax=Plectus sambesii TaxID=2011161 RepID=A0A914V447_9BILA
MAEEEEEEIMAEDVPPSGLAFSGIISTVVTTVESYGWFILFGIIVASILWKKLVGPMLAARRKEQSLAASKKNDTMERQQAVEAARMRLHEKYTEDAMRAQERAEEKRREEVQSQAEEWERHTLGYHSKQHFEAGKPIASAAPTPVRRAGGTKGPQANIPKDYRAFVEELVKSRPVMVFSKTWCPFCTKAKQALSCYRLTPEVFEVMELDERPNNDGDAIQDVLNEMTGRRSVPRVFIGGRCIGGGDETNAAHRNGQLEQMLKDCGVL